MTYLDDPDWLALCDPGERDHVADLLATSANWPAVAEGLDRLLLDPIARMLDEPVPTGRSDDAAARCLADAARAVQRIALDGRADAVAASALRAAWGEFIVSVAASRVYHDLPRKRRADSERAARNRRNASKREPRRPDAALVAELERLRSGGYSRRDARSVLRGRLKGDTPNSTFNDRLDRACAAIGWHPEKKTGSGG